MADQILFNGSEYHFSEADLPCLITYGAKVGGSHFTVTAIADLFLSGSKILFLTAYSAAKDNFLEQIKGNESKVAYVTNAGQLNAGAQAIILESGNEELFLGAIKKLANLNERVVLIKNMEAFSPSTINASLGLTKIILSGDIDKSSAKEQISKKQFKTTIIFTKPLAPLPIERPKLPRFVGYWWSNDKQGLVTIKK